MAATLVFKKHMKNTDLNHRLSVPTGSLGNLPRFQPGQNQMSFWVFDERSGVCFKFHCYKRSKGRYSKPVFSKGWRDFARLNHLKVEDVVSLHKMETPGYGVWYKITVARATIRIFGVDINVKQI